MSLNGKIVVVAGATGVVGSGAVRAFLDAGATVVATSRKAASLDSLANTLNILPSEPFIKVQGDFSSESAASDAAVAIADALAGKPIDHIVANIGFIKTADAPTATDLATFRSAIEDGLYSNFLGAKALLPLVRDRPGASYTLVSGGLAHFPPPMPGLWMATVKNASVNALTLGLASETAKSPVRVNCVCIHFGVAPVGGKKNQLGMPAEKDTLALGPAFVGVATGNKRAEIVCLNTWGDVAKLAGHEGR